ncbi:RNA-binding S4 domain-containing protein [Paucilactobacillus hokkaidonensis JCM 18461]|uniref:RQC P-site tRNA stabilizing factor n=2 Tax=Paucilactobacillus hokkaidonensis TaxID=1193095 RepID=A0A0A1GVU0_9LACO|nr:RNA-binding S4 domain-containing protein [Paucilactobacillus hokkaidonensis]KRO09722.1 S4 domain-containing protein [Paucilactobacillus hokkaidonensis]BAP84978.1 RNA-binding S4 domain-containing protein [Paucilactobacillus hokkaidonensis JCM 18461]
MRLDKFLKVSRIIKRRSVAKEISDQGRITINGNNAKSSSNVSVDDQLIIKFGNKTETVKILRIVETTKKDEAEQMYEIIDESYKEDFRKGVN